MTVGIYTLGCKVNMYESEYVINLLKDKGYEIKKFEDICDIYIINTCTVTNTSDIKSKKIIRQAIKRNENACIVVMGCFIEANKDYREDGVDIIIGTKEKSKIIELLEEYFKNKNFIDDTNNKDISEFEDMYIDKFPGRTRAFVKIQDGCENFCSYCIIPLVRGKCRSKKEEIVIKEIKELVKNGYQEIVLTGIHTGNYGVDLNTNFATLLRKIVAIKGLKRLRISSIEVTELTDEVLDIIKNSKIIADHLHIPLQAGSNETLKNMNRKYDLDYYIQKIDQIRNIRPNISITTDIIVGFPTESEENFNETLETSKKVGFTKIHVFPYSKRNNTKAAQMKTQVDDTEKKKRARTLLNLSKEQEINYYSKFLEKEELVLTEITKEGYTYGHTSNYINVKIKGSIENNKIVKVLLKEIEYPYVVGDINE